MSANHSPRIDSEGDHEEYRPTALLDELMGSPSVLQSLCDVLMPALVSNLEQIASANRSQTENMEDRTQDVEDRQTVQDRAQLPGEPTRGNGNTAGRAPGIHTDSNAAGFITSNAAGITGSATGFIYGGVPHHVGNAARAPLSGSAAGASPGSSFPPFFPQSHKLVGWKWPVGASFSGVCPGLLHPMVQSSLPVSKYGPKPTVGSS